MSKKHFTFVLTDEERAMLDKVATESKQLASEWLRNAIRKAYRSQFGDKTIRRGPRVKRDRATLAAGKR